MPTQEFTELKEMIEALDGKMITMMASLKTCQSRCHVDNPTSRWRSLGRALVAMIKF